MSDKNEKIEHILDLLRMSSVRFGQDGSPIDEGSPGNGTLVVGILRNLMKLGAFSLNAPALEQAPGGGLDPDAIPAAMIGLGLDYALEVAPRVEGDENMISADGLEAHVARIEDTFGEIRVDDSLAYGVLTGLILAAARRPEAGGPATAEIS